MGAVPSPRREVQSRSEIEAARLSQAFLKGRDHALELFDKELGLRPDRKPSDRELLIYEALQHLADTTCNSKSTGGAIHRLAVQWESALAVVLSASGGNVHAASSFPPLVKSLASILSSAHGSDVVERCFMEVGVNRRRQKTRSLERRIAFRALRSIGPSEERDDTLEGVYAPETARRSFEGFGIILARRFSQGQERAREFLTRELSGTGIDLSADDREMTLYYAIRDLSRSTAAAFSGQDPKQHSACVRAWDAVFNLLGKLDQKLVSQPMRALERALCAAFETDDIAVLKTAWEKLPAGKCRKFAEKVIGSRQPRDRVA